MANFDFFGTLGGAIKGDASGPSEPPGGFYEGDSRYGIGDYTVPPPLSATTIAPSSPDPSGPMGAADLEAAYGIEAPRQHTRNLSDRPAPEVTDPRSPSSISSSTIGEGLGAFVGGLGKAFASGGNRGGGTPVRGPGAGDSGTDAFLSRYGAWIAFGVFAVAVIALVKK